MHIVVIQSGSTALMVASKECHIAVVQLLLQYGANLHIMNKVRYPGYQDIHTSSTKLCYVAETFIAL